MRRRLSSRLLLATVLVLGASAEAETPAQRTPQPIPDDAELDQEYAKLLALVAQRRAPVKPANQTVAIAGQPALGRPDAPVTVIEFGTFQCPYCRHHALATLPALLQQVEQGEVLYVFHDFPAQADGTVPAEAARCAAEQDGYLEFRELLLANRQPADRALLQDLAGTAGLDTAAFTACLASGRHRMAVRENIRVGKELGIRGTPAFLIGRRDGPEGPVRVAKRIDGAQPYAVFAREIAAVLGAGQRAAP